MDAKKIEAVYPVSPFQEAGLSQLLKGQTAGQAHHLLSCTVRGVVNVAALEKAWNQVVERHPILRTSFAWKRMERPFQVVHRAPQVSVEQQDWRSSSLSPREQLLAYYRDPRLSQWFNPAEARAARLSLCRTGDHIYVLACSYSRLLLDDRSASLVLNELLVRYDALIRRGNSDSRGSVPYRDYLAWLERQDPARAETFWKATLGDLNSAAPLAEALSPNPGSGIEEYDQRQLRCSPSLTTRSRFGWETLLQGAWAVLLSRYSGERQAVFGVTISVRSTMPASPETMLGPLTNTLPAFVKVDDHEQVRVWLERLPAQLTGLRQYGHHSLSQLHQWIGRPADLPLFESRLIADRESVEAFSATTFGRCTVSDPQLFSAPWTPLTVEMPSTPEPTLRLTYDRSRFDDQTIERLLRHLAETMEWIGANPEARLGEFFLFDQSVQPRRSRAESANRCTHELIEDGLAARPDVIALSFEDQQVSYQELNRRSNRLARYLKELGVGPETRVGICLNRGLNMIEAVLGVLKAGAAYVPLDSSYPLERLAFMLEDAQVLVLISEQSLIDRLPAYWGQLIRIDADWEEISSHSDENPASGAQPGNSAYLIYTSGSTGWPKGVLASHRSLANCIGSQLETYGLTPEDRLLQLLSLSFDAATEEVFLALLSGAGLALHRDPTRIPPGELLDECERLGVTVLHSVPTYFDLLADSSLTSGTRALPGLRLLIAGGESLSADQIEKWRRLAPASRVINAYGPTEATITSTIDETAAGIPTIAGSQVPIGRPIRHAQIYILDDQGHPVPIGVPGELFISGLGLTRGYLNHADHTAEKFVPNPFKGEVGERMYQTGDRGRYRLDGRIEFIGRKDHQVKVRGHRIELGEIEFMLGQCSGVRTAVVMLSKEERLIAFVVPDRPPEEGSPTELSVKNLRSDLEERLPHYMVPAGFTIVDALPLTPNGKIDRQRLPELEQGIGSPERQEAGPRTPEEEVLAGIFQEVLKLDRVGIHDNFFELGGDSILSIQIIARANEAGLRLAPKQLFQSQSIAELAAVAGLGETIEPEPEPVTGAVPLTPIQEWFFEGNTLEPDHYNQAVMLEAGEPLDLPALRAVIEQLADHHEVLRHRFRKTENGWQQLCEDSDGAATLETIDILAEDELQERRAIEERAAAIQRSFDLSTGPLLKVAVFNAAGGARQLVLIVAHHLVIDGVSWRILLGDLERGYQQARRGEAIKPGVKTSSYKRWAERLKEEAQREESRSQADYWLAETGGRPGRLPVDQEGINTVASGRNLVVSLTEDETRRLLQEIPRAYKTQINEVLLAAVGRAIGEWSGSSTVLVEVEGHGRDEIFEDLDLTRTLGWFTTSHPLRIEIAGGSGVEWLRSLKEQVREAGRRGIYFGMLRYLSGEPHLRESLRARSRAEVSFNYLGQLDLVLKEGALFRAAKERPGEMRSGREQRRHLIEINGSVLNGRLHLGWTYSEHVHRQETVEKAANRTLEVLRELIAGSRSVGPRPYTPSDFPLAALNQQRLNQLLAADPDLEDIYPLSPLQKAMLFHALSGMKSEALFEQLSCRLRGRVDLAAFRRAWQGLADRHPILRTSFDWSESDEPVQVVHRQVKLPIADLDWRAVTREEQDLRYRALVQADREQGFDLTKPPLMRLTLVRIDDEHYRLIWSHHHLVLDGWSTPLILQEVFASYEAFRQGREPEMKDGAPYREYIGWLKRQDPQRAEAYWRERLKGFTRPTQLWIDRDSGSRVGREERSEVRQTKMSSEATARLQGIAKRHRLTINTILQGAWGLFLSKYLGEDDLVFGTTVSGRPVDLPGSESIIGPFINTLPVRMRIPFESSLRSWLLELQREQTEYGQYMYSSMVEQYSEIPLGMALYESILIYENYPAASPDRNRERLLEVSEVQAPVRTKYPLTIVSGPGSELALSIVYDLRRYDGREISRFLTHFQNLIERISDNPEQPIWSLSLLSETEQSQLLAQWSGTRSAEADNPYLHRRFEGQAEKSSDSVAVILGEEHVTYGHLNARADRLATQLLELGAGPEVRVGISPGLSSRLPEVLLGILKAGATCLAPEPPSEEGDENRQLSPPEPEAFLMVTPHTPVAGEPGAETRIVRFESSRELVEGRNETASANPVAEGNLALIACTSGTTGRPRRVMLTHRGLSNQVLGLAEAVGLSEEDRVLWRGVLSTNLSIWELFAPLLAGGCLIAVPPAASQNPGLLLRLMAEEQITTACLTPATHALLLREGAGHDGRMAGRVVLSGEMFYRPAGQAFCGRSSASLFNVYSVGEGSGAVTVEVCDRQSERTIVPIGRPLADTQAYLLDRHLEPVPAGVMGEIWIGGAGLARGYAEHPERTAESFRPNPFAQNPGERMFRAQDLGRSLPDGKMQILGHLEHQFKTRFGPINPTLIESALMEDPGIDQAVLLSSNGSGAEVRWTAYLGSHGPSAPSADAWRRDLRERLPAHLIPQHVVTMACLPLTADGRIDRTATAIKAEGLATETGIAEPGSPYEEMLRGIWANLFGVNEVGRDENFFELGGHSLLATQMISRAREAFQLEIPLQYVFETPTIEGLGRKIEQLIRTGRGRHSPPLVGVPRTGRLPLSFAQQRLWFIEQLEPGKAAYNCHIGLRLKGQVDLAALERSISEIVRRHEVLRTRIEVVESMPIQAIDEWRPLRLEVEDLRGLGAPERAEEVKRRSTQELATGFDLSRGPLFRLKMLGLAEEDHVLLFTIHHIVSDAWSMSLLVNEVVRLYEAFTTGAASPLPDLKIQYADYASWQQRHFSEEVVEEHLQYWRNRLSGRPPVINLAGDHPRPPVPSHRGAVKVMALPAELYDALKSLSRREDVTIFMMLLAAFKVLLYRYTSESDLVVGTTLANRNRAEIEDLIGFFINMLPMRTSLDGNPRFTQLLKRIKDTALGAYAHQELPFEKLVEALQPEREVGQTPLFNIAFGVQNAPKTVMKLKGLELSSVASEQESVRFDLTLWITENGETMRAGWTYRTDLFSEETIVRMHAHFETLLFSIMARPDAPLDELEMRSEAERAQQLSGQAAREEHRYRKFKSVKPKAIAISND